MILSTAPFTTFQGTGALAGARQYFVRFSGCGVACPIRSVCDEQEALKFTGTWREPSVVAQEALQTVGANGWVHVTGGEPCDQPDALRDLAAEVTKRGMRIHLQTSGTRRVPIAWDWLTISPKVRSFDLVQRTGSELVVVYDPSWIIDCGILAGFRNVCRTQHFYLQPIYKPDGSNNMAEVMEIAEKANRCGQEWRVTDQFHKHWGIS